MPRFHLMGSPVSPYERGVSSYGVRPQSLITTVTFSENAVSGTIVLAAEAPRLRQKTSSKLLYVLVPGGIVLPIIAGGALAIHYVGFPGAPNLFVMYALLPLGLLLAADGQRRIAGTWEGLPEVLHIRLAWAALVYLGWVLKYAAIGRPIHLYPAGIVALISGVCLASRLLMRFMAHD
jgi:hypothetical protein